MDIQEALRQEHSKAQTLRLVESISESTEWFEALLEIVTGEDRMLALGNAAGRAAEPLMLDPVDASRDRTVPLKVYLPESGKPRDD